MNAIKERVLQFANNQGLVMSDFFKKISASKSNFSGIGLKSDLGSDKIVNILNNFPQINVEWLLTGSGEMLKEVGNEHKVPAKNKEMIDFEHLKTVSNLKDQIIELQNQVISLQKQNDALKEKVNKRVIPNDPIGAVAK